MSLKIIDMLLPREAQFFRYMADQALNFNKACILFKEFVTRINALDEKEIHQYVRSIKDFELKGDDIERFITSELDKTFITPLDREDIHAIAVNIDDTLDLINSISQRIEIYKIRKMPTNVIRFAELIVDISNDLKKLILSLKSKKDSLFLIKKIHAIENEADTFFHNTMADLFSTEKNTIQIIKFKSIYEDLERVVNSVDNVGKVVRGIMVKQG